MSIKTYHIDIKSSHDIKHNVYYNIGHQLFAVRVKLVDYHHLSTRLPAQKQIIWKIL